MLLGFAVCIVVLVGAKPINEIAFGDHILMREYKCSKLAEPDPLGHGAAVVAGEIYSSFDIDRVRQGRKLTLLIRLVLDKAATTDEALKLFEDYDMFAIAGRDYHFFITDRSGKSVTVEFDPDSEAREMVVLPARSATNFYNMYIDKVQPNQKNGHYGHGFERFTAMEDVINAYGGTGSSEIAWEALKSAVQEPNPESITSNTQWSIIYNLTDLTYELVPRRHWDNTIFNDVLAK